MREGATPSGKKAMEQETVQERPAEPFPGSEGTAPEAGGPVDNEPAAEAVPAEDPAQQQSSEPVDEGPAAEGPAQEREGPADDHAEDHAEVGEAAQVPATEELTQGNDALISDAPNDETPVEAAQVPATDELTQGNDALISDAPNDETPVEAAQVPATDELTQGNDALISDAPNDETPVEVTAAALRPKKRNKIGGCIGCVVDRPRSLEWQPASTVWLRGKDFFLDPAEDFKEDSALCAEEAPPHDLPPERPAGEVDHHVSEAWVVKNHDYDCEYAKLAGEDAAFDPAGPVEPEEKPHSRVWCFACATILALSSTLMGLAFIVGHG
eukprot:CAMPEP_0179318916 /NCGR_PEP_ID=MMETSP0797-20121207/57182_1 /TAXON_ID=47934 /ORGANISM="Dinophysis acuminata, Strain DAEP01" /LENGTH=325 /DNA_ID=CAMNT_0021030203 /DNA_START=131 /DNA_END=1106 /DNA_ORIENTATION=-